MRWGMGRGVATVLGLLACTVAVGCALLVDTGGFSGGPDPVADGGTGGTDGGTEGDARPDGAVPSDAAVDGGDAGCTRVADDTFATGAGSRWAPVGDATLGSPPGWARLTTNATFQAGAVWWNERTKLDAFDVSFAFVIEQSGPAPADGLVFAWIDGTALGVGTDGDSKGFVGPGRGYGVALDTYQGGGSEPGAPSVQVLTKDKISPVAGATVSNLVVDGNEHVMTIRNRSGVLEVWIDQVSYLKHTLASYVAPDGIWGFTAGTGGTSQVHRVSRVTMTFPNAASCPP